MRQLVMITGPNMSGKIGLAAPGRAHRADGAGGQLMFLPIPRPRSGWSIAFSPAWGFGQPHHRRKHFHGGDERDRQHPEQSERPQLWCCWTRSVAAPAPTTVFRIAWAIAEYLHEHAGRPKTLFATHYHELNEMAASFPRIRNANVAVREADGKVLFLRKLVPGGSDRSFGIHVAQNGGHAQHACCNVHARCWPIWKRAMQAILAPPTRRWPTSAPSKARHKRTGTRAATQLLPIG